jgi:acyl-CoA reductase-like NAD-dependent aldehyde dehydrogenase
VVIKPSEHAPVSTLGFAQLIEEAGFPPGVVNVVTGLSRDAVPGCLVEAASAGSQVRAPAGGHVAQASRPAASGADHRERHAVSSRARPAQLVG